MIVRDRRGEYSTEYKIGESDRWRERKDVQEVYIYIYNSYCLGDIVVGWSLGSFAQRMIVSTRCLRDIGLVK